MKHICFRTGTTCSCILVRKLACSIMKKVFNLLLHSNYIILVLLHTTFTTNRPLTVSGAYVYPDGTRLLHQMTLERVEDEFYVIQNNSQKTAIFVNRKDRYYEFTENIREYYNQEQQDYIYNQDNKFFKLGNEQIDNIQKGKWYLFPRAYAIILRDIE